MEVKYRKLFLKDFKKLKHVEVYDRIYKIVFEVLPQIRQIREVPNIKAMRGYPNRYRIRLGDYRVGIDVQDEKVEVMRALHRKEFYRYFP